MRFFFFITNLFPHTKYSTGTVPINTHYCLLCFLHIFTIYDDIFNLWLGAKRPFRARVGCNGNFMMFLYLRGCLKTLGNVCFESKIVHYLVCYTKKCFKWSGHIIELYLPFNYWITSQLHSSTASYCIYGGIGILQLY